MVACLDTDLNIPGAIHHVITRGLNRQKGKKRDRRIMPYQKDLGTQTGMTNEWLKEQGLVSIKELWVKPPTCRVWSVEEEEKTSPSPYLEVYIPFVNFI
jgi:hypothetical protein